MREVKGNASCSPSRPSGGERFHSPSGERGVHRAAQGHRGQGGRHAERGHGGREELRPGQQPEKERGSRRARRRGESAAAGGQKLQGDSSLGGVSAPSAASASLQHRDDLRAALPKIPLLLM